MIVTQSPLTLSNGEPIATEEHPLQTDGLSSYVWREVRVRHDLIDNQWEVRGCTYPIGEQHLGYFPDVIEAIQQAENYAFCTLAGPPRAPKVTLKAPYHGLYISIDSAGYDRLDKRHYKALEALCKTIWF